MGVALVGLVAGPAMAGHGSGGLPAGKVYATSSATILTDTGGDETADGVMLFGPISYKVSTSADLIVSLHMECKIVTTTKVKGKKSAFEAGTEDLVDSERGFARVWVKVAEHDNPGNFYILNTDDFPATDDPLCDGITLEETTCLAINAGAVTMCDRAQVLTLDPGDDGGTDFDLELKLATLQTHGFTWYGKDIATRVGTGELDIYVMGAVFGDDGALINVRKRVVEIGSYHFAN